MSWKTFEGETPLLLAARGGHVGCVRTLLEHDADVNATTNEGYSPLWEGMKVLMWCHSLYCTIFRFPIYCGISKAQCCLGIDRINHDFVQGQGNPPKCQRNAVHDES